MPIAKEVAKAEGARDRRDMPATLSELYPEMETTAQFFKRYRNLCQERLSEEEGPKTKRRNKKEGN